MLILMYFEKFIVLRGTSRKNGKNFSGLKASDWVFMHYSHSMLSFSLRKANQNSRDKFSIQEKWKYFLLDIKATHVELFLSVNQTDSSLFTSEDKKNTNLKNSFLLGKLLKN